MSIQPKTSVFFTLNGASVEVQGVSPSLTLNAWLRAQPGLTGTKKMCGEGGCGCCLVAVSLQSLVKQQETTFAMNSVRRPSGVERLCCGIPFMSVSLLVLQCLCPLLSIEGWKIMTVEGIGRSVHRLPRLFKLVIYSPPPPQLKGRISSYPAATGRPQWKPVWLLLTRLRHEHVQVVPSQCGILTSSYYTVVSTTVSQFFLCSFLQQNPTPTVQQIENIFDGNICRCTGVYIHSVDLYICVLVFAGYRPILDAMKTFAAEKQKGIVDIEVHVYVRVDISLLLCYRICRRGCALALANTALISPQQRV